MSGHSKWSTIKHQKQANDQKRGKLFTKLAKAITVAVKEGGGDDPEINFKLRMAIDQAQEANMPKDNIKRAVDRGMGRGEDAGSLETVLYEGYGPEKIAVMIEAVTDNRNRTVSEIKYILEKWQGSLGQSGSVSFMFKRVGQVLIAKSSDSETQILKIIDLNVDDVLELEEGVEVVTKPKNLSEVKRAIKDLGYKVVSSGLVWVPNTTLEVSQETKAKKFLEELEDHEDVQKIFCNLKDW